MYRERKMVPERGELMQELILWRFEKDCEKYRMAGTMELEEMYRRMFGGKMRLLGYKKTVKKIVCRLMYWFVR